MITFRDEEYNGIGTIIVLSNLFLDARSFDREMLLCKRY